MCKLCNMFQKCLKMHIYSQFWFFKLLFRIQIKISQQWLFELICKYKQQKPYANVYLYAICSLLIAFSSLLSKYEIMAETRQKFKQRKLFLTCYRKFKNVAEVLRRFMKKFKTDLPMRLKIAKITYNFEDDGTVQNIQKQRSGRPRSSTSPAEPW